MEWSTGLLPPIIYAAGFSLKQKAFFRNFSTIMLFAVVGTIISTLVFGLLTYALYATGAISAKIFSKPLLECLIYGSLISAIDPVATLSVFADLNAKPLLYNLVFGESVLNDAVAIVLFKVLSSFHAQAEFTLATIPYVFVVFSAVSLGSILVGVACACLCALLLKGLKLHTPVEEASPSFDTVVYSYSLAFLSAYLSYLLAEAMSLSGIMSLFFTGICHAHYCFYNMTKESHLTITKSFDTIAFLCETFVFLYLGIQVPSMDHFLDPGLLLSAIPFCLISRALNIFPLAHLANKRRVVKIPMKMQMMQWACGLRGAIAYALSVNMPRGDQRQARAFEDTTLAIVIFSTLVFGGATGPLLKYLRLRESDTLEDDVDEGLNYRALDGDMAGAAPSVELEEESMESRKEVDGTATADEASKLRTERYTGFHKVWKGLDKKYFIPMFRVQGWEHIDESLHFSPRAPRSRAGSQECRHPPFQGAPPSDDLLAQAVTRLATKDGVVMEEFPQYEAPELLDA